MKKISLGIYDIKAADSHGTLFVGGSPFAKNPIHAQKVLDLLYPFIGKEMHFYAVEVQGKKKSQKGKSK